MKHEDTSPGIAWRSKWRWVFVFWVVQAVVLHMGWTTLMSEGKLPDSWDEVLGRIQDGGTSALSAIIIGTITVMQAMLLMPVHRPGPVASSVGARLVHCGLSATVIASVLWLLFWPVAGVMEVLGVHDLPAVDDALSLSIPIAAWIVSFSFLWPRKDNGVPVLLSVSIAALGAALLLTAILGAVGSIFDLAAGRETQTGAYLMLGGGSLAWIVFTPLLLAFGRKGRPESALAKFAARIFLGTMIEAAAIIPLDVMVRRKFSCYCNQGTFWALTFCWGVGALALGPAIFLLPLSSRRKRWYAGLCDVCDYDMSGCMDAERCPECGADGRRRRR